MSRTDDDWIRALKADQASAHSAALTDLRDYLRKTLTRGFGRQLSSSDLDDLTQESLVRVHRRVEDFQGNSRFTTWAASVAVHCALSELRRRRYRHVGLDDAAALGASALQEPHAAESPGREASLAVLERGIAEALTHRQRQAILAKLGGLPLMEIAERLQTTQGAVYKLLHDARTRLRDYVERSEVSSEERCTP